jgi:hypothetical protein
VSTSSRTIDRIDAIFDDPRLVANAGLILAATLIKRLGLEALINQRVRLTGREGGSRPGRKVLTLVCAIIAGATHIDHVDILRAGATERVLPFRVMAPSTIGTFLRCFTFGHVRQLDAVADRVLQRVWSLGAGPAPGEALVIDVDSTITEVHGHHKQGAAYGYTRQLGYHPLLATRAGTGEVLHARMRKGSAGSSRGVVRFVDELVARVRRAGADGQITLRADSGFWSWKLIDALDRHGVLWSITVTQNTAIRAAIATIPETAWADIDYTLGGKAQIAECDYVSGQRGGQRRVRLVVRRTRLTGHQAQLFPDWRHHAFITNVTGHDAVTADAFHRNHAVVELAIRELKEGAGLEHCPSGHYSANAAWLAAAVLAHNLLRWTDTLGDPTTDRQRWNHHTMRTRLIALAATLVNRSGKPTLRLPLDWPWADRFTATLTALRTLPAPSG